MPAKKRLSKKTILKLVVVLVIVLIGGFLVWRHFQPKPFVEKPAKTTSNRPTAQSNYSSGAARSSSSGGASQGGATDNKGAVKSSSTASGSPITSSTGLITLQSPTTNQTIGDGAQIYGTAQVGTVSFQLVDNTNGLIAQGSLSVVNGKFSGTLKFHPYSSSGKLNVFSQNTAGGPEVNIISIPVGLQ